MTEEKTPLYQRHIDAGAKMVEFGGWLMPVQYKGILEEHHAVRKQVGIFDVSHMGEFTIKGQDAEGFLQKIVTNDIATMQVNQVQYSPMCYENGGTVDDLLIYKYATDDYLLVVNGANITKDWEWLQKNKGDFQVEMKDISPEVALLALQGPISLEILRNLTLSDLDALAYYRFYPRVEIANCQVMLSRTGYTGEDGFEIYCSPEDAIKLWDVLLEKGVQPAGLGARDTLRFEACLPLYGHELSAEITPVEAGVGMFVKVDKAAFNGKMILKTQKEQGVERKIMGFEMTGRGIARGDYAVYADSKCIGKVTTGSPAPTVNKNLGLALINKEYAKLGQEIFIEIRGKHVAAQIIAKPFYKREGK